MALNLLSDAATLGRTLQDLQDRMAEMSREIAAMKRQSPPPATPTPQSPSEALSGTPDYLPSTRIPGTSWPEEMDRIEPLDDDDTPDADVTCSEGARVAEVSEATQELLKRSFVSLKNPKRLQTRNAFALPKVAVTKAPSLDHVMASQCSKSTKSNDWSLSRIQALMLDAIAPLSQAMELFHSDAEEISSEQIAKAVESAITLLGNASSQMSSLRRTRVLQEYNRELVEWAQLRETKFNEAAPALFGQDFPEEVTKHLAQVDSLKKAKAAAKPQPLGFQKAYPNRPPHKSAFRPTVKNRLGPYPQVRQQQGGGHQKKPRK